MADEAHHFIPWVPSRKPRRADRLALYYAALEAHWRWLFAWLRALWGRYQAPRELIVGANGSPSVVFTGDDGEVFWSVP